MAETRSRRKLTPPEIARRWGISPEKVLTWIRNGELRAIDASTRRGGRPRYLVDEADLAAFEVKRAVTPAQKTQRRKRKTEGVTEWF